MAKVKDFLEMVKNFDPEDEIQFTIVDPKIELHVVAHEKAQDPTET